jgi:hypothetical protein
MDWILFLHVLMLVESGGDINAVGDKHLQDKAYGLYQIRQIYLDDVNRIAGTSYTMDEVRHSKVLSRWCVIVYVRHYGKRYTRRTGLPVTMEVAARLHNGGPNGPWRESTDPHWGKFQKILGEFQ